MSSLACSLFLGCVGAKVLLSEWNGDKWISSPSVSSFIITINYNKSFQFHSYSIQGIIY
jgi:hypothetical protein